jgi:translation initiation factor 2 beta subunit (eIF-2beta)/eIF-5
VFYSYRFRKEITMKVATMPKKTVMSREVVQRILRKVPYTEGFRFSTGIGDYTGQVALSLEDFAEMLRQVDLKSIAFHMERRDFEKWVRYIFADEELAQAINRRTVFQGENLRKELVNIVTDYIDELKKMPTTAM